MKKIILKLYKIAYLPFRSELIFLLLLFIISAFTACRPKFYEEPAPGVAGAGSVSFNKYVAVGSTISAGYMDGALYTEGQENSYPNLIAARIKEVNPALGFFQPDITSVNGWQFNSGRGRYIFGTGCVTISYPRDTTFGDAFIKPYNGDKTLLTNLSVPFIDVDSINTPKVAGTATSSTTPKPYYDRIVDPLTTLGIASEAKKRNASFFTVFLGYEDALKYATKGGTVSLPSTASFQKDLSDLLDSLLAVPGSKGVIATIPYVDLFPVVTNSNRRLTSSTDRARNPVRFRDQVYADSINTIIGQPNLFSGAAGNKNYYAIKTGAGTIRQLNPSKDFVVKSSILDVSGFGYVDPKATRTCKRDSALRNGSGFSSAFNNADILDANEVTALRQQIDAYNTAIRTLVATKNAGSVRIAVVDLNDFYNRLTDPLYGIQYGSLIVRANHPSLGPDYGGFYSLDRKTPTPRGQALLANEFIKVINQTWGASLHLYDPANFRTNPLP